MYEVGDLIVYGRTGICEVTEITTLKMDGVPKDKLYYILRPVREKHGKVFTPVDNEKIVMRKVISKEEAEELIREIPQIEGLWIGSEKQREEKYKECIKYSEPELVSFFEKIQKVNSSEDNEEIIDDDNISIFSLLPAYALSEIKSAFIIGFYIYLPFVVVDLVISSVLLTLGMMMMSPVIISTPIKLILFVAMDGWTMLSKGLILQYFDLSINP